MSTVEPSTLHSPEQPDSGTELETLLSPEAGELLSAVATAAGGKLVTWRPRHITHEPGRSSVVQYRTQVGWPEGETTRETFVAATGERIPENGAAIFENGGTRVAMWRWPHDPYLPGLADALAPANVAALLDEVGLEGGAVQLRTRAYRPGRRAVVEANGSRGRLFLKVLRPDKAEALHDLHRLLSSHLPVPTSLGWTNRGVVILEARPGQRLRDALRSAKTPPPSPEKITALLDRFPSELNQHPRRQGLVAAAERHSTVIASTVPSSRPRLDRVMDEIRSKTAHAPRADATPVHGDLYEAQLLVARERISGLLDVDTAGAGSRAEDLANFSAHLSVLALTSDRPKPVTRYGAALLAHAESSFAPEVYRPLVAAAVIGLATGPFRVQETEWEHKTIRRLELAGQWLGLDPE